MNIVVGYVYNNNGMSTWCIEAARAMSLNGHKVLIVKSADIVLPADLNLQYINFEFWPTTHGKFFFYKVLNKCKNVFQYIPFLKRNNVELVKLDSIIKDKFFIPHLYLHNQSNIYNSTLKAKQFVVAWAYKPFLFDYINKAILIGKLNKSYLSETLRAITWFNYDIYAYKNVTAVLCVTKKLCNEVKHITKNAFIVYPSYYKHVEINKTLIQSEESTIKLCIMSLYLDDPRKGVLWMLNAINQLVDNQHFTITLIGNASQDFINQVNSFNIPTDFKGYQTRVNAIEILKSQDVLLFGSVIEDWGFVQVEAMAYGIPIIAPEGNPCDEIIGREDFIYKKNNVVDFQSKISNLINLNMKEISESFINRYDSYFSPKIFASAIEHIVDTNG